LLFMPEASFQRLSGSWAQLAGRSSPTFDIVAVNDP
jgi:hypothetical protein